MFFNYLLHLRSRSNEEKIDDSENRNQFSNTSVENGLKKPTHPPSENPDSDHKPPSTADEVKPEAPTTEKEATYSLSTLFGKFEFKPKLPNLPKLF